MSEPTKPTDPSAEDPTAVARKRDHIELAFKSQVERHAIDNRFYYEPVLAAHPGERALAPIPFLGKTLRAPIWVSSMTGGTEWAGTINRNLALACRDFGLGMGLGSCRALLHSDDFFDDFHVRPIIGEDLPLFANLGIAQIERLISQNQLELADRLLEKLQADGLIIHINPLQEAMQPEGDRLKISPLETIRIFLEKRPAVKVIVKEVGQGMGYQSLRALFQLPVEAIEFAASGGTNFAMLELLRSDDRKRAIFEPLAFVGHTAEEMVTMTNAILEELGHLVRCKQVIVSGGVRNFLDGYYLLEKLHLPAVYGQASGFLRYARGHYEELFAFVQDQLEGFKLAKTYLRVR